MSTGGKRCDEDLFRIVKAPYVSTWGEFFDRAKKMFKRRPNKVKYSAAETTRTTSRKTISYTHTQTRYTTKYTQEKQMVVVKVTDDFECLKYRTDSVAVVKQLSELSGWVMEQCTQNE